MTIYRVPLKEGDTVYHNEKRMRGKVLGRLKQWFLLELEGTHEKLKARRGEIKLIHPKVSNV